MWYRMTHGKEGGTEADIIYMPIASRNSRGSLKSPQIQPPDTVLKVEMSSTQAMAVVAAKQYQEIKLA